MGIAIERQLGMPSERERLIAAFAHCCARRGYRATTVEEVVSEAALGREDFERLFADIDSCAKAAVESILGEAMTAISVAYSADTSEWESVLRTLRSLLELFAARPALSNLAFIEARHTMPPDLNELYRSGFALLSSMLDRLRSERLGEDGPPAATARAVIGGGEALVRREIISGRAERLPQLLPDLVYVATVPFLGQEEALRLARSAHRLGVADRRSKGPDGAR